jgi:NMD protein affecting ribosome stability and mRNA decay
MKSNMKIIYCCKCGDEIQNGYAINPENSAICETCYNEECDNLLIKENK